MGLTLQGQSSKPKRADIFYTKCIQDNIFGETSFFHFRKKVVPEKHVAPQLKVSLG